MKSRRAILLACLLGLSPLPAVACLHGPESYEGTLGQDGQEAIVFWNEGREELILRVRYELDPQGDPPPTLAWVVPVPTVPDAYGVEDPQVFSALYEHWAAERNLTRDEKGTPLAAGGGGVSFDSDEGGGGVELLAKTTVGPYEIQPIRLTGAEGGTALNAWLGKNGFAKVPAANMKWYVEQKWVWLCVKIAAAEGRAALAKKDTLRPLRISFASERIVYPLKFSTHQGEFEVRLWVITDQPVPVLEPWKIEPPQPAEDGKEGVLVFEEEDEEEEPQGPYEELVAELRDLSAQRWMPLPAAVDAVQLGSKKFAALENRVGLKVPCLTLVEMHLRGEEIADWSQDLALQPAARVAAKQAPAAGAAQPKRGPDAAVLARVFATRAHAHRLDGRWAEGLRAADALIGTGLFDAEDLVERATFKRELEDFAGALEDLEAAEAKGFEKASYVHRVLLTTRARVHADQGRFKEARVAFELLASLEADLALEPSIRAGWLLLLEGRRDAGVAALRKIREGFEPNSEDEERARIGILLGAARNASGDRAAALKELEAAVQVDEEPDSALWHALLSGDTSRLVRDDALFDRDAEEEDPEWPRFCDAADHVAGRIDAAELLRRAKADTSSFERRATLCRAHAVLGLLAEKAGDAAKAREHYRAAAATRAWETYAFLWAKLELAAR